ncbi:MAG TPA: hypothetical protein VMG10_22475 [Gemmataceae bacterium]|nr:hypothetical protein [Gemmataceae bacterium]
MTDRFLAATGNVVFFWSAALFRRFFSFDFQEKTSKTKRRKSAALQKNKTKTSGLRFEVVAGTQTKDIDLND